MSVCNRVKASKKWFHTHEGLTTSCCCCCIGLSRAKFANMENYMLNLDYGQILLYINLLLRLQRAGSFKLATIRGGG